jgi:hypothetical protein
LAAQYRDDDEERRRYTQKGIRECAVDISRDGVLGVKLRN